MCIVASGHLSLIQDHESPMIIQGEYEVHLLDDEKVPKNACLSVLFVSNILKPFFHFSLYQFSTISPSCSEFGYHFRSSSHGCDSLVTHIFSKFFVFINVLLGPTSFISKSCLREKNHCSSKKKL